MSRSGYSDDCGGWSLICWRGAVESAIRGARGQALLRDMLAALDAMPAKRLIAGQLIATDGEVCALGAVARARDLSVAGVNAHDREGVAAAFGIAQALAAEIAAINDDDGAYRYRPETPEQRFERVRAWVAENLRQRASGARP